MTQTATSTPNRYWQELIAFRASYPLRTLAIGQHNWTTYDTGGGRFLLLLLHGGGGHAEAMFPQIMSLSRRFRVIAPNIPPQIRSMEAVVDGLSTLLNALDMDPLHVYGVSLGGHIAQVLIRRQYDRIQDMVLSHTAIPAEHLAQKFHMQYRMLQVYPAAMLSRMFKRATRNQIVQCPICISDAEREFWLAYFDEQYDHVISKAHILSRAALMRDYFRQFTFHASDLNYWRGRLLIIESSDDDVYEEGDRGALLAMYSRAWLHTFEGYTHLATILAHQQSADLVSDFLKGGAYDGV